MQQQQAAAGSKPKKKQCAEVCVELLLVETVRLFYDREMGPTPAAALEAIGYRIGMQLVERYTKDRPRLGDTLEVIKFVCKDFWQAVFKKQVDNLKTNHRGIYVLQDNNFRWLQRLSPVAGSVPSKEEAHRKTVQNHLYLPCGIIRGALSHLGVNCTVEADPKSLPGCGFTVKIAS